MMDVVVALDLSGEGAVSDYKKLLQGLIWKEAGHQRELAEFLLRNQLLTLADLNQARKLAADNERRPERAGPAAAQVPAEEGAGQGQPA